MKGVLIKRCTLLRCNEPIHASHPYQLAKVSQHMIVSNIESLEGKKTNWVEGIDKEFRK